MTTAEASARPATENSNSSSRTGLLTATSLMLFSMFFGAGNLIFPPMLGTQAGQGFQPAIIGFLITGVAIPVVAVIAVAQTGNNVQDLAKRGGKAFGLLFPVLVYLTIGCFYALPRTGVVSYSTAIVPITGWSSTWASAAFSAVFFGVSLLLALNPQGLVDKLGKILTPALLALLALLVLLSMINLSGTPQKASGEYADNPLAAGLIEGYLTMDSLAALAFGIVVVNSLRYKKVPEGKELVSGVSFAAVGAGALLALIYVGLGLIGQVIPEPSQYEDGATLLSAASKLTMGQGGMIVFGTIVLLACITTSVGLIGATSEFFNTLLPGISYRIWACIFSLISFGVSTMGMKTVLAIAGPIIGFLYPAAITLIFLTLIEPALRRLGLGRLRWTFVLGLYAATIWAALMSFDSLGWGSSLFAPILSISPMHNIQLGWVIPTLVAAVVGLAVDSQQRHH